MHVYINNEKVELSDGSTLAEVLSLRGLDAPGTAVAVDNRVVLRTDRAAYRLTDGARIVVIKAACGG